MSGAQNVSHFAIECDDVERAKRFYEAVFGWTIRPWGPPNYYHITTGTVETPGILGDLRERRHKLAGGSAGASGYICTINIGAMEPTFPTSQWISVFATTNIYFHLSTAYGILRSKGVQIGKRDLFAGGI